MPGGRQFSRVALQMVSVLSGEPQTGLRCFSATWIHQLVLSRRFDTAPVSLSVSVSIPTAQKNETLKEDQSLLGVSVQSTVAAAALS